MSEQIKYSKVAQILHWLVAGLIVAQYVLAELAEYAASTNEVVQRLALLANHKSIGMTVLALALIRVIWRIFHKPPMLPDSMSVIQKRASHAAHWTIYVLIFALPLSGWLMSSANAYAVSWFNIFVFPDLVSANKSLAGFFHSTHEVLGNVLLVLVIVHVLAALKHHFIDKDGILQRMANVFGWVIFVFTLVIVLGAFGRLLSSSSNTADIKRPNRTAVAEAPEVKSISDLPVWVIDYQQSFIQFTADQAGAPFDGLWTDWQAEMQFDVSRLDGSAFNVKINTAGVSSKDEERDEYIIGSDFFDAENFKTAIFTTGAFVKKSDGEYTSLSQLSIKGLTKPLLFIFTVSADDSGQVELNGSATIDRFAWNVGIGDWSDPTWVGQDVTVKVRVVATVDK